MTKTKPTKTAKPAKLAKAPKPTKAPKRISVRASRLRYDLLDPLTTERAIEEICEAYEAAKGVSSGPGSASDRLGVIYHTLWRYLDDTPPLKSRVDVIRRKYGIHWAEKG